MRVCALTRSHARSRVPTRSRALTRVHARSRPLTRALAHALGTVLLDHCLRPCVGFFTRQDAVGTHAPHSTNALRRGVGTASGSKSTNDRSDVMRKKRSL